MTENLSQLNAAVLITAGATLNLLFVILTVNCINQYLVGLAVAKILCWGWNTLHGIT